MASQFIGIDIGALFLKVVKLDAEGKLIASKYIRHKGEQQTALSDALLAVGYQESDSVGVTGVLAASVSDIIQAEVLDITRCQLNIIRKMYPDVAEVIDIGGASATLVQLDGQGNFKGYATNSMCAAGTGSFLDEQANRLGITYSDLDSFHAEVDPPTIATRCSVFAKSDLIHRQQEGYSKSAMWSGLCRGMTRTLLGTLLHGRPLQGATAIIGGVGLNQEVMRWLEDVHPGQLFIPEQPQFIAAMGAALEGKPLEHSLVLPLQTQTKHSDTVQRYDWMLAVDKSSYPSFDTDECFVDENNNEIRINNWQTGAQKDSYLGIDIGSTSTKLVFIDEEDNVFLDIYRKTAGDPVAATKLLFSCADKIIQRKQSTVTIKGVGTTGSGRKIIGTIIGADAIINEISAHVAGAVKTDSSVDTIFEIGGQDSKYMHVVNGHIRDANMNYVCAAGTGSFIEEQANKLGYPVEKVGSAILNQVPPRASDRCTVFMEQDVAKLLQAKASPEEALAAVMVSVTKNYLNKVVGNRYRNRKKIFFQGATARNQALVAAFEKLLDVEVVVSPYCHVMGAYGVALLTHEQMKVEQRPTTFSGLDLENRAITLRKEVCDLCQNDCTITYADIEGQDASPSWGYMCGRDPDETKVRVNLHERLLRKRAKLWREAGAGVPVAKEAPVIGIPLALTMHSQYPFWQRFFNTLGYRVQLSGKTSDTIREIGTRISGADFCFPAKISLGHSAYLAQQEGVDFIFIPQLTNEVPDECVTASTYCPYVQGWPSFSKTALSLNGIDNSRIISPVIDKRKSQKAFFKDLTTSLAMLNVSNADIQAAWKSAMEAQQSFEQNCRKAGQEAIEKARDAGEKMIALIGRPYNNFDSGLNLGLPQKIAELGRTVIPMDFLDIDLTKLGERYKNIYWNYGQKILAALEKISQDEMFDAIYLTNFSCGPDSFLLSYAEEIMGDQPFLALELDEHGADAGYLTRIEAFFDVLSKSTKKEVKRIPYTAASDDLKSRHILIPSMHPFGTEFIAAAFRQQGYRASVLPPETEETFEIGRSVTRGSECLPTALTIGNLLHTLKTKSGDGEKYTFFMPTAQGPCRFGQYCTLHRQILDREGFNDVSILSPTSINGYQGVDEELRRSFFKAMLLCDVLLKAQCKVRPYEVNPGETDKVIQEVTNKVSKAIESSSDLTVAVREAIQTIAAVKTKKMKKPVVGVVGEIYVRNNNYANEELIRSIEQFGGEAWVTPLSEWMMFTSSPYNFKQYLQNKISMEALNSHIKYRWLLYWEHKMYAAAGSFLDDRHEPFVLDVIKESEKYMPFNIGGEGQLTIGRAMKFSEQGAALVVNCAPFGCMPGAGTTALFRKVSDDYHIPIVNLFYDGNGNQNKRLEVFLNNAVKEWSSDDITINDKAAVSNFDVDNAMPSDMQAADKSEWNITYNDFTKEQKSSDTDRISH